MAIPFKPGPVEPVRTLLARHFSPTYFWVPAPAGQNHFRNLLKQGVSVEVQTDIGQLEWEDTMAALQRLQKCNRGFSFRHDPNWGVDLNESIVSGELWNTPASSPPTLISIEALSDRNHQQQKDTLRANPTLNLAVKGGMEAGKMVGAAQAPRACLTVMKKLVAKYATPEQMAFFETPLGEIVLSLGAPLAVHALATGAPNVVPQAAFVATAAGYAYTGQAVRLGFQYSDMLADLGTAFASEMAVLAKAGAAIEGGDVLNMIQPAPVAEKAAR